MPFGLTYHDYLANAPGLSASENAVQPMTEDQWNALPMDQQWGLLGHGSQGINVNQFDNRYQGLLGDGVSGGDNNDINVHPGTYGSNTNNRGVQRFKDPSQIQQGQGYYATAGSNATADAQRQGGLSDAGWAALVATLFAGGAAAGGLGGGAVGAPGMSTSVGGGFGTGALGAGGTGAAFGAGAGGAAAGAGGFDFSPHQYTGQFSGGSGVGDLGADFVPNGGFDFSPHPYTGQFGGGPGVGSLGADFVPSSGGLLSNAGNLASRAGQWVVDNPLRAFGLAQIASGLLGHHDGGATSGGGGGSGGGPGKSGNGSAPPMPQSGPGNFYVNPYTLAQLQRSYQ